MPKATIYQFPRSTDIKRAIAAVTKAGIAVGSVEITPTGGLRIYAVGSEPAEPANDFDEWDKRGAL